MTGLSDDLLLQLSTTLDQLGREIAALTELVRRNRADIEESQRAVFGRGGGVGVVARLAALEDHLGRVERLARMTERKGCQLARAVGEAGNLSREVIVPSALLVQENARLTRLRVSSRTKIIIATVGALAASSAVLLKALGII